MPIALLVFGTLLVCSFGVIAFVGVRARRAVRGLWTRFGELEGQLQDTRNSWQADYRRIYSDFASYVHGVNVRFESQSGEDIYLWNHFGRKRNGVCVEVGAFDGKTCSNTYAFEMLGWQCFLIEPDPEMAERCRQNRPKSTVIQAAAGNREACGTIDFHRVRSKADWSGMMSFVAPDATHLDKCQGLGAEISTVQVPHASLDAILTQQIHPPIDFVTIDVEGYELQVLDGFDLEYFRPAIIVAENTYDRDSGQITSYLAAKGYRLQATVGCNSVFVRRVPLETAVTM